MKSKKKLLLLIVIVLLIFGFILIRFRTNGNVLHLKEEKAHAVRTIIENNMLEEEELSKDNCVYTIRDDSLIIDYYEGNQDSVIIPLEIDGREVTTIDTTAFETNDNLEIINIPKQIAGNISEIKNFEVNEILTNEDYVVYTREEEYSKEYLEYVQLSKEQKNELEFIPDKFIKPLEEIYSDEMQDLYGNLGATQTIPSQFDLRNVINVGVENQGSYGICYAYSELSSVETNLALRKNVDKDFSEVHLAVVSNQGYGGNFADTDEEYFKKGYGPISESIWSKINAENRMNTGVHDIANWGLHPICTF